MCPKAAPQKEAKEIAKPTEVAALDDEDLDLDLEDGDDAGRTASAGGGGGVTPAFTKPEEVTTPMTPKNFRNHPDMENFFRFIYDNDLRIEALEIIDGIIAERKVRRKKANA